MGNEWEDTRLLAFVVRPNAAMRFRLRKVLQQSIVVMKPGDTTTTSSSSSSSSQSQHYHIHSSLNNEPSLGLHIRHGDSLNDFRGALHMDRSLTRHMQCATYLASRLGVNHMYLATDNATLFTLAPERYPQFVWHAQQRALKLFDGRAFEGYFNEKSVHQDVANILVC